MPNTILRAMHDPDRYVLTLDYLDSKGNKTRRVVSPIKTGPAGSFLGLCLCREDYRRFRLERCSNIQLTPAHEVLMPVALQNQS